MRLVSILKNSLQGIDSCSDYADSRRKGEKVGRAFLLNVQWQFFRGCRHEILLTVGGIKGMGVGGKPRGARYAEHLYAVRSLKKDIFDEQEKKFKPEIHERIKLLSKHMGPTGKKITVKSLRSCDETEKLIGKPNVLNLNEMVTANSSASKIP